MFWGGGGKKAGKSSQRVVRSDAVPSHISISSPPPCTTHGIGTGATSCLPQFPLLPHQLQFFWGGHTLSSPYASSMRGHVPPPRFRRMQGCSLSPPGSGQHPRAAARSWVLGGVLRWDAPSPNPPGSGLAAPANPLRLHPEQLARLQPGPSLPSQQVPPGTPPLSRGLGVLPPPSPCLRQPPPHAAGPGALINYLIFPLCLIYSPARLWPYAAFVVSGSLLWQAAFAAQTPPRQPLIPPPFLFPPHPPQRHPAATPEAPWRAPRGGGEAMRGGG